MNEQFTAKSRQIAHKGLLLAAFTVVLMMGLIPTAKAAGGGDYTPSFDPPYFGSYHQKSQHIQTLQIQIHMMEQHITMIEYEYKFVKFTPQGLRAYRQWIYNLRLRQAQLRWALSRAMAAQVRR